MAAALQIIHGIPSPVNVHFQARTTRRGKQYGSARMDQDEAGDKMTRPTLGGALTTVLPRGKTSDEQGKGTPGMDDRSQTRYSWNDLFLSGEYEAGSGSWEVRMLFGQYDGLSPEYLQISFLALEQMIEQMTEANPGMQETTARHFLRGLTAHRLRQQAQGLPDWPTLD